MSASEAVEEFERGVLELEANAPLAALHEATGVSGDARMRELAARIAFPSWPGATSATALKRAAQEAEITAVLDEYAARARALIRPADQERWEALVAEMQRRSGEGLLADELGRSAVGASLLREKLGGRPHRARQRGGIDCACGYAVDGVLPRLLCPECGDVLLRRWVAEERRLLRAMPTYADEITHIIEVTAQKQSKAAQSRGDYTAEEVSGQRRAGGRRLARLARTHRAEVPKLDLRRWSSFIVLLSRDARPAVRTTAAKAEKRGLGAAALTELSLLSNADAIKVAERILEKRKNSWRV